MEETSQGATAPFTQANTSDETAVYEVGFHLLPTLTEAEAAAAVDKLRTVLGSAEILKEAAPVKIPLAYIIERRGQGKREKYGEAYFGFIKFATEKANIAALEHYLRATHEVLRHLLIETVREDASITPRRAVFASDRLEGETLKKPEAAAEVSADISEADLDKSIDALVA
ncbi:MAG TPA: 30S ribosomal protein S6 [Candidatus Paceibacterota bacterium]